MDQRSNIQASAAEALQLAERKHARIGLLFFIRRVLGIPVWAHVAVVLRSSEGVLVYDLVASRRRHSP